MNPNTPFSGQQPGPFQVPSRNSGMIQIQPPLQFGQLSLFGPNSGGVAKNPGFPHSSDFTRTSELRGPSSQTLGFGQPLGFTPSYPFGHAPSFVGASTPTSSSVASKQGFSFKPPTNLGTSQTSKFGDTSGETSGRVFAGPEFSFKTPENAVFKPIFGMGSEPQKTQNQIIPPLFPFSFPGGSMSGRCLPFGISQENNSSSGIMPMSFTKPVSSSTLTAPFTASLPSKTVENDKKGLIHPLATPSTSIATFSFPSSGSSRPEHEVLLAPSEPVLEKGAKRKEEQDNSPRKRDYDTLDEPELQSRSDHSSNKRPVRLTRPRAGGLFSITLQNVLKSNKDSGRPKKESKMERVTVESGELEQMSVAGGSQSGLPLARSSMLPKEDENKGKLKEGSLVSNLGRRNRNSGSTESFGSSPASELTAIQCKNIPDYLNDRTVLENHFKKFVKIQRIHTNRKKKLAVVHCFDHASAALARKKAKELYKDIVTFWHKKKPSPNKREYPSKEQVGDGSEGRQKADQPSHQHSPLCKSLIRSAAGGNLLSKSSPAKKPGLKKSLQFEADTFDSGSESHGLEHLEASASSLSNLIGMVAESSEDKYHVLDQRDKIMRQARVKRTDLAQTFIGTCPDMCPEKERYMRETRNQLSIFEVIPGTDKVDHAAAIKEYSRSSADQEEPLPHELRPLDALSMTMDYLVTRIMDKGEGNLREWYDFVWNRTRGIRKDITQQHLCSPLTVSLIEKCTRFHIHCSHHMCEEPMSSFDAKINNENMTKCLQSLKELYQDLANKEIYCKNEAEFRGYNVLLNLNKGDILREVQQFRPEVRNSSEVRFAVQAFAALNSNNFVRFFKCVKTASYLNACLLHCYFSQIRRDALKSLNIAYTVNAQRSTIFPLDNVVRMLLFRDSESASDFISYYGLSVSDGFVELNRSAFLEPENFPKPKKSPFVSQKLTGLVGEIVCGGPLPPVTCHVPVCSFNGQNKYTGESAAVDSASSSQKAHTDVSETRTERGDTDSESLQVPPPLLVLPLQPAPLPSAAISTFQPVPQPLPPPPKPQPAYCDTDILEIVEELVRDVLEAECREVSSAGAAYVHSAISISESTTDELITEVMLETLRQIASSTFNAERERFEEEKRRAEEERRKKERERLMTMLSQSLGAELSEEVVREIAGEISAKELKSAVEEDRRARVARCSKEVCAEIVGVFLEDEIFHCAKETLQELQCFCKYLQRWREAVAARKKLKRQMRAFPAAPCCVDPQNRLKALSPSAECPIARENLVKGIVNLGHAGRLGTSCCRLARLRQKMNHQMKVQYFYQQLLCDAVWTPLDLPSLVAENIPMQEEKIFWKVLLVLPTYEEFPVEDPSRILADWLKAKFTIDNNVKDTASTENDLFQTLALHTSLHVQEDQAVCVNVCVKVTHGTLSLPELDDAEAQKELLGTRGLILLLPPRLRSEDVSEEDVYWLSALLQLKRLLQAKPFHPLVPLVVFVPNQGEETLRKEAEEGLMLPDLISANLISDYIIVEMPDSVSDLQGTSKLTEAVQWLVSQCPGSLELCCQTLLQYIEDGIDREFSHHFYEDRKERLLASLPSQDPSAIIELYNSVVQFLAEVASSEELCELSWPVTEFAEPGGSRGLPHLQWNTPSHLAWLKKALLSFQIPQMDLPPLGAPWRLVCTMILQYLSQTASSPQTQAILQSQVESLLSKVYFKWRGRVHASSEDDGPSVEEIPWDSILELCINHKLRDWKPPRLPVAPEAVSKDGQVCVYFLKEHLQKFIPPSLWEEAQLKTQKEVQQSQGRSKIKSQTVPRLYSHPFYPEKYDASVRNASDEELHVSSGTDLTLTVSYLDRLPERLSAKLQLEKNESKRFDEQLQQFLVNDSEPVWDPQSLPLYLPEALVSVPQIIPSVVKTPVSRSPEAGTQMLKDTDDSSLAHRLSYLKHLIRASKEEEVACEFHLSTVLDMTNA
ncbi:germinal-center associated nuclear protein [Eublepharis macularius]|uniref:Germinal-center associated nuclear protein n=1 Tax=Eublepharis macularius TaxID=481883 RepID=A0AA97JT03_EUBMA|nr:germinal-center associated nuclear protein [Eublepharis macularius]